MCGVWEELRSRASLRRVEGPPQLIALDARPYGAPGWNLRVEQLLGEGWLAHLEHQATGALVPAGPQLFATRELALAEARRLAGV